MKKKNILFAFCLWMIFSMVVSGLPGCSPKANPSQNPEKPVVGVILPFSSAFKNAAQEQKNAMEMALSEMGGPMEVIFQDGRGDAAGAIEAFRELAAMKKPPLAVITCGSWASQALHPLAKDRNIFHIAIASAVFDRIHPRRSVRFTLDIRQEERQLREYLSRFDRIAILYMDNSLGKGWAELLNQNLGPNMVASIPFNPDATNFHEPLSAILEQKPEALVLLSADNPVPMIEQAREMGITAQLVGTRPIERLELLKKPAVTNGLVYTYPTHGVNHPFIRNYEKIHAIPPTHFGMEAYDAVKTLMEAYQAGNPSPETLFAWYANRSYNGALGEIFFNENGDAIYPSQFKEVVNGQFQVAAFQFDLLLEKTRQEILHIFHPMDREVAQAARQLSAVGLQGKQAQAVLRALYEKNDHAFDCVTVDNQGIILAVAPERYAAVIGADISKQEQIMRLHASRRPVFSHAINTVEGFVGFDLEHPIFSPGGRFLGSVSLLTKATFFDGIISGKMANFPIEIFMMQKDGRMVYDLNKEEIGKNTFTDPMFAVYPELQKLARKMAVTPEGSGRYEFLDKRMAKTVAKKLLWKTLVLHGTEFRLALAHPEN